MNRTALSLAALAGGTLLIGLGLPARQAQGAIASYALVGSFPLESTAFDLLPDGRVMRLDGNTLSVQDAPNANTYSTVGSVPDGLVASYGASFLRVNPAGTTIAIGDNTFGSGTQHVLLVNTAALSTAAPSPVSLASAPNTEAAWADNSTLYVSGYGTSSQLTRINSLTLATQSVVSNIGDGSGGVTVHVGRVYTGVGYDFSEVSTGAVRSFDLSALNSAASSVNFSTGAFAAKALSGSSLDFDESGNLLIGGGDFFSSTPDAGYAAVIDPATLDRLQLSPAGTGAYYAIRFNHWTHELLVIGNGTAYRYAAPAPGAAALLGIAGSLTARRRRARD